MLVPGLGVVGEPNEHGWRYSEPIALLIFGGKRLPIVLESYDADERKEDFHVAIANFLAASPAVLRNADDALFDYYRDYEEFWLADGLAPIQSADELWKHVTIDSEPHVKRNKSGDGSIYVTIECNCDWEPEHGLEIVLKNGLRVTKLGQFDDRCTNSDAYGNELPEEIIYVKVPRG